MPKISTGTAKDIKTYFFGSRTNLHATHEIHRFKVKGQNTTKKKPTPLGSKTNLDAIHDVNRFKVEKFQSSQINEV